MAEVIVAMALSLFVMAGVSAMAISGIRTSAAANVRNDATDQLRIAQDALTKEIRTAYPLSASTPAVIVAESERFAFYAQLDSLNLTASNPGTQTMTPSTVWLWTQVASDGRKVLCQQIYKASIVSGSLSWPAGYNSTTAVRTCHVVARGLATTQLRPTFTYLAETDTTFATDATGASVSSLALVSNAIPAANYKDIASVELWMTADIRERGSVKDPSMVARVTMPNNL